MRHPLFLSFLDERRLKHYGRAQCNMTKKFFKKVLDKIPFLCYNVVTLREDEQPLNEI